MQECCVKFLLWSLITALHHFKGSHSKKAPRRGHQARKLKLKQKKNGNAGSVCIPKRLFRVLRMEVVELQQMRRYVDVDAAAQRASTHSAFKLEKNEMICFQDDMPQIVHNAANAALWSQTQVWLNAYVIDARAVTQSWHVKHVESWGKSLRW
jgi:hypothetical protein